MEIKTRIGMAKDAFNKRREQLTQRMDRKLKKKTIKAVVWSVALYGSETWTMRKNEIDRLRAFEMWILRRMENISWKDKVTNEQVLEIVKEKRTIIHVIRSRKKKWIGHVWRKDPHADIEELRFTRDLFGLVSSPFLLGGLILEAHQWKGKDPKTVAELRKSLYVDDIITGGNTVQEAQLRKDEVTEILGDATFTLHKWASNAKELEGECDLAKDHEEQTAAKHRLGVKPQKDKLLVIAWNKEKDTLKAGFHLGKLPQDRNGQGSFLCVTVISSDRELTKQRKLSCPFPS